jgi:hypothetical protein
VIRGVPEFVGDTTDVLATPAVIVEVLSDATERFDRGEKFAGYLRFPRWSTTCSSRRLVSGSRTTHGAKRLRDVGASARLRLPGILTDGHAGPPRGLRLAKSRPRSVQGFAGSVEDMATTLRPGRRPPQQKLTVKAKGGRGRDAAVPQASSRERRADRHAGITVAVRTAGSAANRCSVITRRNSER